MMVGYVTSSTLMETEVKRNIRLVNYAIIDFYTETIKFAKERNLEKRREIVKKDLKRFWRLKEGKGVAVIYVDVLKAGISLKNIPENCFSIVPCVIIDTRFMKKEKREKKDKSENKGIGVKNY